MISRHAILLELSCRTLTEQPVKMVVAQPFKLIVALYYRRTKKYLSYDGNHSFLGVRITSYKYVDYKAPLPKEIIQDKHLKELVWVFN